MARVVLEHVSKSYPGGVNAVAQFSLVVKDCEFVVLVGPSGCGKTTTLRLIAGLETPGEGSISIGDRVVTHVAPKDRNVAMVFQNYGLYPHLSVYRNMSFALELRYGGRWRRWWQRLFSPAAAANLSQRQAAVRPAIEQTARQLGIEHLLQRRPGELSGGERQRVALGRAIVREPAVFLFDEPLSNLDAKLRVEMRRELKQLHRRLAATIVYVTHDQVEAMTLGDRIVVMHQGQVQQVGTPSEVYRWPRNRFVAGFLGSPAMNFVAGTLRREGDAWQVESGCLRLPVGRIRLAENLQEEAAGNQVEWGIRPENLALVAPRQGTLSGRVEMVEQLGDSTLAHIRVPGLAAAAQAGTGEASLVVKSPPAPNLVAGAEVGIQVDVAQTHVFAGPGWENLAVPD